MTKFIRNFAFIFTLFSLYELLIVSLDYSLAYSNALQMALIMSSFLTLAHYSVILYKGYKIHQKPIKIVDVNTDLDTIIELLSNDCWILKNRTDNSLIFTTKPDYTQSFGEIIEITLIEKKKALIKSKSRLKTTLFDFGKNLDNVTKVAHYLE